MNHPALSLARELEAALAWWQAAGVDCDFADDATAWLAEVPAQAPPAAINPGPARAAAARPAGAPAPGEPPEIGRPGALPAEAEAAAVRRDILGDSPPGDLAAFARWWLEAPQLAAAGHHRRIPPRGPAGAALMVLVPGPEPADQTRLLEGPQGRLLANMLGAMGLDPDAVYIASALPVHTPMADLAAIGASGMDAVLAHHIKLAAPQRLLVLGAGIETMLNPVKDEVLRGINQTVVNTPVMVSETLEAMLHMPKLKARFWRRWMEWSASR